MEKLPSSRLQVAVQTLLAVACAAVFSFIWLLSVNDRAVPETPFEEPHLPIEDAGWPRTANSLDEAEQLERF